MHTEELGLFNSADWKTIRTELIRYAEMKAFEKAIRSVSALPEGKEPADIALLAIEKTLRWLSGEEGDGCRRWNRKLNPELLDHLKDAVDSEMSNLVRKKEHATTNYSADVDEEAAARILEEAANACAPPRPSPEEALQAGAATPTDEDLLGAYLAATYEALQAKGDEDAILVLMSFEEQAKGEGKPKHQVVAEATGMKIEAVRNAVKRIRIAALAAKENVRKRLKK